MSFEYIAARLQGERDALQAKVERMRRAADFWDQLVKLIVARPEWRTFYEADERGACDEVMIDYLAALQTRIDAVTGSLPMLREQIDSYVTGEARGLLLHNLDILVAALGVDPQKEEQA